MISNGTYKARAVAPVVLGRSHERKTPFVELYFEITEGENKGGRVRWTTYFTENTNKRSLESLLAMGFEEEDLGVLADGQLHGLDTNVVDIVVKLEEYEKDGEKRVTPRVQWVNDVGGYLNTDNAMSDVDAVNFGDSLRGLLLKLKGEKGNAEEFKFGANEQKSGVTAGKTDIPF